MGDNSLPEVEVDSWCRTTCGDKAHTTFTWTIEDFLNRPEQFGESLVSSTFIVPGPNDKVTTWELLTYPKGKLDRREDVVPLYIRNTKKTSEKAKFTFSILNKRRQKRNSVGCSTEEYIEISDDGKDAAGFGFVSIEKLKNNPDLLPGGSLTLVCDLTVYGPEVTISGSKFPDEKPAPSDECGKEMNDQIGKLFGEKKFSDVKITCGEEIFYCHKNIEVPSLRGNVSV